MKSELGTIQFDLHCPLFDHFSYKKADLIWCGLPLFSFKFSQTNMWKKPHYLIGQLHEILPCNLISQHAIFHEVRWMLISDPLLKFPLVHELIVCGLIEIFLHEIWLKIWCETIADVIHNYSLSCKR